MNFNNKFLDNNIIEYKGKYCIRIDKQNRYEYKMCGHECGQSKSNKRHIIELTFITKIYLEWYVCCPTFHNMYKENDSKQFYIFLVFLFSLNN